LRDFTKKYADRLERLQFEALNQVPTDLKRVARDAIALAARVQTSKRVFVIMGFSEDPRLQDAYESFKEVCEEFEYECRRVDDASAVGRIIPAIFEGIRRSAFVIADLTEQRPNVYYELGLAHGLDKPCIVAAYSETTLPFDVHDVPTIFWESQKQLKDLLRQKIKDVAAKQGR
jgi:hypothetical protein